MNKKLMRIEAELTRHVGYRIRFVIDGKAHLGRIECCQYDNDGENIWVWVTPSDPAVCKPWPRLKLSYKNVAEILDNPYGYKEGTVFRH